MTKIMCKIPDNLERNRVVGINFYEYQEDAMNRLKIIAPYIALAVAIILQYYIAYSNPVILFR